MRRVLWGLLVSIPLLWASPQAFGEDTQPPRPGKKERCPVCGMFVAPYPVWTAAARFQDGSVAYFDGPKDMLRYSFEKERFDPDRKDGKIESLWVTEYYTATLMPAAELLFVVGSDVLGPMGHELVPIQGDENAKTFKVDHRGKKVLLFREITPTVLSELP